MSGELAKALVAAQAAMPKVEPDAVNPHFKTKFVSLDHLIAKTRPVLNKHGLAIVQFPVSAAEEGAALRTLIVHESGETLDAGSTPLLGLGDMQKLGAAITYARRYGWASALGISADEDDDGETSVKTASKPVGGTAAQRVADRGARSEDAAPQPPQPVTDFPIPNTVGPQSSEPEWRWPSGKHKGKSLVETPLEYVLWYRDNGPREDAKEKINVFLGESGVAAVDGENIPFGEAA